MTIKELRDTLPGNPFTIEYKDKLYYISLGVNGGVSRVLCKSIQ